VNVVIVPRRSHKSAEAYQKVWTSKGSPLLFHTQELANALASQMAGRAFVDFAMRYGNPSIESKILKIAQSGVQELLVVPLYPQYALSSTQSTKDEVARVAKKHGLGLKIKYIDDFYASPGFIDAFAKVISESVDLAKVDQLVMSFHGLPVRHLTKIKGAEGYCYQTENCSETIGKFNKKCYRAQSFQTARLIAEKLNLKSEKFKITFQSRLGRTEWIKPYTDVHLNELAEGQKKNVAVVCPSFVSDCLETIEEIGIRAKEEFEIKNKGQLTLIPCLNSHPAWVSALRSLCEASIR
jgi:ferrochelatase